MVILLVARQTFSIVWITWLLVNCSCYINIINNYIRLCASSMHHHHQGLITNKVFNIIIGYASSKCTRHVIIKVCIHLNIQSQKSAHSHTSRFCSCWDFKLSESTITQSVITAKLKIIQPYQLIIRSANQKYGYVKALLMSSTSLVTSSICLQLKISLSDCCRCHCHSCHAYISLNHSQL